MKLAPEARSPAHLQWQPGAIIYRSIVAALVAFFLISAVSLSDRNKTTLAILAIVFALFALVGLVSWRPIYGNFALEIRRSSRALASPFRVWRLNRRANLVRTRQIGRLLSDLDRRRTYLRYLLERSLEFRDLLNNLSIFIFRGHEDPLATLVFSDSLEAMGFHVQHLENLDYLGALEGREIAHHLIQTSLQRRVIILGQGIDEQTSQLVSYLASLEWMAIPFYLVSRQGMSLFGNDQLHDVPTELYLGLKDYIERAASLAKGPRDPELEHRSSEVPPVYR
jgi:hypothetical protein